MRNDLRNSTWLASQQIVMLLVSLVTLKLNLLYFGRSMFDIWILLASVWGVGGVLDLGFGIATVRFVARAAKDGSGPELDSIVATGFAVFLGMGLLILAAGHGAAALFYFGNATLIPPPAREMARWVFAILGAAFYLGYIAIFFRSVLEGLQHFASPARIAMGNSAGTLASVVAVTVFHLSMVWLASLICATAALQCLVFAVMVRRARPGIRLSPARFRTGTFRQIFGFSMGIQATYILGALIDPLVKYIIGSNAPSGTVSLYEVARRFAVAISGLFAASFKNMLPKVSVLAGREDYRTYVSGEGAWIAAQGIRFSVICFGLCSAAVVATIVLLYGLPESVLLFYLLAMAESVNNAGFSFYVFLIGIGKASVLVVVQTLNLVLTGLMLIAGFSIFGDATGIAGYCLAVITGNLLMGRFVSRESGVPLSGLLRKGDTASLGILLLLIGLNVAMLRIDPGRLLLWEGVYLLSVTLVFRRDILAVPSMLRTVLSATRGA